MVQMVPRAPQEIAESLIRGQTRTRGDEQMRGTGCRKGNDTNRDARTILETHDAVTGLDRLDRPPVAL